MKIIHYFKVAFHFKIWTEEFWLGLFHDSVEDGYLSTRFCKMWSGLDHITRRDGEIYMDYILRVSNHRCATNVKLADLEENQKRATNSLNKRYFKAETLLKRLREIKYET